MSENGSVIIKILGDDKDFQSKLKGLGNAAAGIMKATAAAAATATASVAALGTAAIDAYADYEQLTGGIDTLFKESAETMKSYAANAYQTTGMSANAYMENVTAFSASLLQSLGGDTAAAAKAADMAMTDMADNANKMGTAIDSVVQTYQSMARGNYAMLDNLKLGYGGTKAEMERLLADAQKLSGIKYDISSFADIVDAIHVVQTEMGITGTTAKEASTTISGSIASMKAAWTNFLVGLADETQDLDGLMEKLLTSVGIVAENLIPRVEVVLGSIGRLVMEALPQMAEGIPELLEGLLPEIEAFVPRVQETAANLFATIGEGLQQTLPELIPIAVEVIAGLVDSMAENLDTMLQTGIDIIVALGEGIINALPTLIEKVPQIVISIADVINHNATRMLAAALELLVKLGVGLIQAIPTLVANIPAIIEAMVKAFFAFQWVNLGANLVTAISNGVKGMGGSMTQAASDISAAFAGKIKELPQKMLQIGKDIVQGIINGIKNKAGAVVQAARELAANVLSSMKNRLDINSPSKVMRDEIGVSVGEGVAAGITKSEKEAVQAAKKASESIKNTFSEGMESRLSGAYAQMKAAMDRGMSEFSGDIAVQSKGNTSYTTNTTNHQEGDFVVHIDQIVNDGSGTVEGVLREAEFIRKQRELAKGGL